MRLGFARPFAMCRATAIGAGFACLTLVGHEPAALAGETAHIQATPAIFGAGEVFSKNLAPFQKWTQMLERHRQQRAGCRVGDFLCDPPEWRKLINDLRDLPPRRQVEAVNAAFNRYPYVASQANWGEANHWSTPLEFLRKSGQCQDYAIVKYMALRESGMPADRLRVVVLRDVNLQADHAVLVAFVDQDVLVLDNQIRTVTPIGAIRHYRPYYSINEQGWWMHQSAPPAPGPRPSPPPRPAQPPVAIAQANPAPQLAPPPAAQPALSPTTAPPSQTVSTR